MSLRELFTRRARREQELEEEICGHLQMATRDRIRRGENAREASDSVRREFGNRTLVKEVTRELWGWSTLERLLQDLRYSFRTLRKNPGFAAVAILSIALGIGVNTAMFSLIDAVLLKALRVRAPQQLVAIGDATRTGALSEGPGRVDIFSYPFFERFRRRQQAFSDVYATGRSEHLDIALPEGTLLSAAERIRARFVSGNFFAVLGVRPNVGRLFTEEEGRVPGSAPVIVISHAFWRRVLAQDPGAVGRKLVINGSPFTVIGVTPPEFSGDIVGAPTDIWLPITMQPEASPGHDALRKAEVSWLLLMGRLRPGVSLGPARAEVQSLAHAIFGELYAGNRDAVTNLQSHPIEVTPGRKGFSRIRQQFALPLAVLMSLVAFVLLICCANVANLQLARATARTKEMSLRLAIGASRSRLMRQLLTESLVIAFAGATLGLCFAASGVRLLLRLEYVHGVLNLDTHLDAAVLAFTAGAAMVAVMFGLAPALEATRQLAPSLKETKSQPRAAARTFGKGLVMLQIVFSLVLLVGAGLFLRTLQNLNTLDLGYERNGLLVADIDYAAAGYGENNIKPLVRNLIARVQPLPGVEAVSASENGLFSGTDSDGVVDMEGFVPRSASDRQNRYDRVGPDYFYTTGTRILSGRGIRAQDSENAPKVAVINESMARFYFPHGNPLGMHIFDSDDPSGRDRIAISIVGVVRDVKENRLREPAPRRFYIPIYQHRPTDPMGALRLEVRTRAKSSAMLETVRLAIKSVDAKLPVVDLRTADDLISDALDQDRLVARLSTFFGVLALVLAAMGLYGVMSYLTARRTTEIGVRMALGARRETVMRMVLGETFRVVGAGLVLGVIAALLFTRLVTSILFGLSSFDVLTMGSAAGVIAIAAAAATYVPARRASKIDPMVALRYE